MGGLFAKDEEPGRNERRGSRSWGAMVKGIAEVGPSASSRTKKVTVMTEEHLPHKPTFTFEISKSQSQGCKGKFAYAVKIKGAQEFQLTVTRTDIEQGWEQNLHIRWQAGGGAPKTLMEEADETAFDEEVAQMVAMGYTAEKARQALQMKSGDLGAAASFIGACDIADTMKPDAPVRAEESSSSKAKPQPIPEDQELDDRGVKEEDGKDTDFGKDAGASSSSNVVAEPEKPMPAVALASMQTMLEPEPIGDFSN